MIKKPLILVGGGGHCKSCIDVIEVAGDWEIKGILDHGISKGDSVLGYPVVGGDDDIDKFIGQGCYFLVTVGQIRSAAVRARIFAGLKSKNAKIATVISAVARVSRFAEIGAGTIVHHRCVINAGAIIGENNIINTGAVVEHESTIGDNNHISTTAVLNGNANLGNNCFIGSGSVIFNGISITDNVVISAGSLVSKNIDTPGIYAGSPVRKIKS